MKKHLLAFLMTAIGCGIFTQNAAALGGSLKSPVLVIPLAAKPGEQRFSFQNSPVTKLFEHLEKEFPGGYFINWNDWLYFSGSVESLNGMLKELARADGVKFSLHFSTKPIPVVLPFEDETNSGNAATAGWMIHHNGQDHSIQVTVYSGVGGIDQEKVSVKGNVRE